MSPPGGNDQENVVSITLQIRAICYTGSRRLDHRLQCHTPNAQKVILNVWDWTPAAEIDWQVGEWYHLQNVVVKQRSDSINLDTNKDTHAESVAPPRKEETDLRFSSNPPTPSDRCGFTWPDDYTGNASVSKAPANCCYREIWRDYDRCIWHADTEAEKPVKELQAQRETPENRKLNKHPRELLTGAILREDELTDIVLTRADLSGSELTGSNFTDVYLGYTNLSDANLRDADLSGSTLSRIIFSHANLERANLRNTSLFAADFTNANLSDADLSNTTLRNADFTNAILIGANLADADREEFNNAESYPKKDGSSVKSGSKDTAGTQVEESTTISSTSPQRSLTSIPGIGEARSDALRKAGYNCAEDVALASVSELSQVNKITREIACAIREAAKQLRGDDDTLAAKLASELGFDEADIRSAYAKLAPIKVSPSKAEQPLMIYFDGDDDTSVLHLDVYSLRFRYLLWADGYQSIKDIAQASVSELCNVKYIQENHAKKFKQAAETVISEKSSVEREERSGTDPSDSKSTSTGKNEITALDSSTKESSSQNNSTPSPSGDVVVQFDETSLSHLLETYISRYDRVFSADNPHADWRKEFAQRYSSKVHHKTEDSPLTPEEIQQLLRHFIETKKSKESVLSRLDGPLSHPKWETLMAFVDTHPETASDVFTYLLQPNQSLADRISKFMGEISTDAFNAVGSEIANGTKSISPSPLLGLPTTILMFAFPKQHISYQYGIYKQFFESYSDYNIETAGKTDLVSQYVDVCSGAKEINRQLDQFLDSPTMIDVRNIIRYHEELEKFSPDGTAKTSGRTNSANRNSPTMDTGSIQPTPNQLSEYYEAFRSVRNAIEDIAVIEESNIQPNDPTQPAIQYYQLICAILESESILPEEFIGYGPQQANRVSYEIPDYRQAFGNGTWVTDYQEISVAPFHETSQRFFEEHQLIGTTDALVRPVSPTTNSYVPEIVETKAELCAAMDILAQFPAYPATPMDPNPGDKRIPIVDIYNRITADIDNANTVDIHADNVSPTDDELLQASPVAGATPTTREGIAEFLIDYEKLTHLFWRIKPPNDAAPSQAIPVFALDWYEPSSRVGEPNEFSHQLLSFAKNEEDTYTDHFRTRVRDLIHRRFLHDVWDYDYITVFPGHEAGKLSPPLVELAQDAVLKTPIVYAPLLERTETAPRQRQRTHEERLEVARSPKETLQVRSRLQDDTVILLDDVCTSGASLMAGAHLLRAAGAKRVIGLGLGMTVGTDAKEISSPDASVSEIIATGEI